MKFGSHCIALVIAALAQSVPAAEPRDEDVVVPLDCAKAISTVEINQCAALDKEKVEAKLNATYQEALKFLSSTQDDDAEGTANARSKLIEAQRAWVRFREADCDAVYQLNRGGTMRTVLWIGCMQMHAERRIQDLRGFIDQGAP